MNTIRTNYQALSIPVKRILWIILVISLILGFFSLNVLDTLLAAPNLLYQFANAVPFILTILSLASAGLIISKRIESGIWLFFGNIVGVSLLVPFLAEGFGFPVAVLTLIVTITIPIQVMRGRTANLTMIFGITVAGSIVAVDTLWPFARVPALAQDVQIAQYATLVLTLLLFLAVFAIYRTLNVGTKLLILTLSASLLSVVAVAGFANAFTETTLTERTNLALLKAAEHTADALDAYITQIEIDLASQAQLPIFFEYLSSPTEADRNALRQELDITMRALIARDLEHIGSYALLSAEGITAWDTYSADIGIKKSNRDYFIQPKTTGEVFISPVRFSPTSPDHGFYVGAPIFDPKSKQFAGVLRVRLRSSLFQSILAENNDFAGSGSYPILADDYNIILANPNNPAHFGRTPSQLDALTVASLSAQGRVPKGLTPEELSLNMVDFTQGLRSFSLTSASYFQVNDEEFGEPMQAAVIQMQSRPWKLAFLQPRAVALATINEQNRAITIIALVASFLLGIATLFISNTITAPIARLTETAEQLSAGNLGARASIRSQDELGTLATTLNEMSEQLEQTLTGLEHTISARTAELEQQSQTVLQRSQELEISNERSQRRATQLIAIAAVSNAIATIQNLEELLPRITKVINEQFAFYHVGIFLNDTANKYAVLRATNSEGGQRMLARGHRLEIGMTGLVGTVAATSKARIALDTGADAVFFNNPDLPGTRSEMALPLTAGKTIIGVLDVQSIEKDAFSDEDVEILTILANQVSIAIRNTQLLEETQRSNAEIRMLLQQDVRAQWLKVVRAQKNAGLYYDGSTFSPPRATAPAEANTLTLPIKVRGQAIGRLGIKLPTGTKLNQDELDIVNAITERLAVSAENARLLEDSQERATKEQKIGEIAAKIGASINLRSIMQTAVEELGQALPGSEVSIRFEQK